MKIVELSDGIAWDAYVLQHPHATVCHLYRWKNVIEESFQNRCFYFAAKGNGRILGVLPTVQLKSHLFGNFMISVPYLNYGGALSNDPSITCALKAHANDVAGQLGCSHLEYRDSDPDANVDDNVRTDKISMLLDLPGDSDTLWQGFTAKLRAQIRRPLKEQGVTVKTGARELLDDYYQVFSQNMRDLGTPVYAKEFFTSILRNFPERTAIIVVYHNEVATAAAFLLTHNGKMDIPWASSLRKYNRISVNMLLYWEVLKYAIQSDCHTFDFGRCSKGAGTYKFKKQWGASEKQLYWYYWLNDAEEIPHINPNNPKYKLVISMWQKLPLVIANRLGPKLVKYLP